VGRHSTLILPALFLTACQSVESLAPVTSQGRAVSDLFWLALALSAVVFLLVVGLMTYALVRFRARRDEEPDPEQIEGNRRVELVMTAIPAVVLAVLFALTVPVLGTIDAPPPNPLRVQVIGHQWWWEYRYPDLGFVTANELHVPVGEPVELSIGAADVIHSFWVPAIGWKRDAVPGKVNLIRFVPSQAGRFEGTCTEFCGTQHAWMRVIAVAEPRDAFDAWAQGQRANAAEATGDSVARGRTVLLGQTCINCHAIRGTAAQGSVGPDLTHLASRTTLGTGVIENNPENLRRWIRDVQEVKPGVLMPAYRNMSDADLDAMAAYLGSLR
jgi:cytochrome c oxidase subunit 2